MIRPLVERTMEPVRKALADAKKSPKDIDEVVLVGGSTRIPLVQETVKKFFGKEPHKGVNPDEVVAVGAAVQGGVLARRREGRGAARRHAALARRRDARRRDDGDDPAQHHDPDAEEGDLLDRERQPDQSVEIHVLQGERAEARYNRTLGKFHLEGIPPAPRGMPKVEVTFDIDANGILSVTAKDMATGKDQRITITASSGLNEDDIERMVKDAAEHEAEDKRRRDEIERRNKLDNLCYTLEKQITREQGEAAGGDVGNAREPDQGGPRGGREAGRREGAGRARAAREGGARDGGQAVRGGECASRWRRRGRRRHPRRTNGGGPSGEAAGKKKGSDVIDAEFEETAELVICGLFVEHVEVAIVGGGPAGISAALFLSHAAPELTDRIVVLEKEHYPREKYCAGGVGARADKLLGSIGVPVDVPGVG